MMKAVRLSAVTAALACALISTTANAERLTMNVGPASVPTPDLSVSTSPARQPTEDELRKADQAAQQVNIDNDRLRDAMADQLRNDNDGTRARVNNTYNDMKQTVHKLGAPVLSTVKPEDVPNAPADVTPDAPANVPTVPAVESVEAEHVPELKPTTIKATAAPQKAAPKQPQLINETAPEPRPQAEPVAQAATVATTAAPALEVAPTAQAPAAAGPTNNSFNELRHQVEDTRRQADADRKEARSGIAGAMALAGIPSARLGETVMVGVGAGAFHNQSAIAFGASANIGRVAVKAGVTGTTNQDFGANMGVGIGW